MSIKDINKNTEDKAELITDLAEDGHSLSDEELNLLTKDPEVRRTYRDLMECRTVLKIDFAHDAPDARAEWHRFQQRIQTGLPAGNEDAQPDRQIKSRKHISLFMWGVLAGIAASLLIVFLYSQTMRFYTPSANIAYRQAVVSPPPFRQSRTGIAANDCSPLPAGRSAQPVATTTNGRDSSAPSSTSGVDERLKAAANEQAALTDNTAYKDVTPRTASISGTSYLKVTLPDGTTVWMNPASRITYPKIFIGPERTVTLDGEAFFQVKHDPDHPFIILARNITARVLGTELNVSSYAHKTPHVTLIKGRVEVGSATSGRITLLPGQDACVTDNGNIAIKEVDTAKYKYWKEGYLYFDNETLADAMKVIGSWYNVKVVFKKKEPAAVRIHFFCNRNLPVEKAVADLNKIYNLDVSYKNRTIYIK